MYQIKIGTLSSPSYTFTDASIISIDRINTVDLVTEELTIDEFTPHTFYIKYDAQSFAPKGYTYIQTSDDKIFCTSKTYTDLRQLPYGTTVYFYRDNVLIGKYYSSSVKRVAKYEYEINCISAIGLFDTQTYSGGMFSGATFETVATAIIGGTVAFSCEEDVRTTTIYGWIPYGTKREALQQLMFATSATLTKDTNGDIKFSYIYSSSALAVPDSRIYIGGDVDYGSPASGVRVTEHGFSINSTDEEVVLFDNSESGETATNKLVLFDEAPVHDLTWNSATFSGEGNCNYAVVNGIGVLKGKKYTHVTSIVAKNITTTAEQKIVTVSEAYLISALNSENVANRLMSYYSAKKVIKSEIVLDTEQCGRKISFHNPYNESEEGYIYKMDISSSSNEKASCEIITNYTPQGQGNAYTGSTLLTGSGTWSIPATVLAKTNPTVKAIIMGGGNGGQSGGKGGNGVSGASGNGAGGSGGVAGTGGNGGNILVQIISVSGLTALAYACGTGGSGGAGGSSQSSGGSGTASTITAGSTTYSSSTGSNSPNGYQDIFTGTVYARSGQDGQAGGDGGDGASNGSSVTYSGTTYSGGTKGANDTGCYGGGGGGASVGANGSNGGDAYYESDWGAHNGGGGGAGATAIAQTHTSTYAEGGYGGHGGGGGGGGGTWSGMGNPGDGGTGGNGGSGASGGAGAILIYY